MANMTFGVNIIPKNTTVTLGNSSYPWKIESPTISGSIKSTDCTSSGTNSFALGQNLTANHKCQFVIGEYNSSDASTAASTARGNYIEIVGNGTGSNATSNARSLDWSGNEYLKGDLYVGCGVDSSGGSKVVKSGCTWGDIKGS